MRHIGEKLAFGATGGQGMLHGFFEGFGTLLNALFEQFLMLFNFPALLAKHLDHLVEALGEELDFVTGLAVANGAELAAANGEQALFESLDGLDEQTYRNQRKRGGNDKNDSQEDRAFAETQGAVNVIVGYDYEHYPRH